MRIASLVPSATEMLFELGLGQQIVAVTHECDWPAQAPARAHLTRSVIPEGLGEREIDEAVRELTGQGKALYELDAALLERLEVDLIVTQAVCEVCAVSYDDVVAVAATLPTAPRVLSLDPSTIEDVLADIERLGAATGTSAAAAALTDRAKRRLLLIQKSVSSAEPVDVIALEWLDPPFIGGHWVPQMIKLAGGIDMLGRPGERSRELSWSELAGKQPELVVVMPCGYDAERASKELEAYRAQIASIDGQRIVAVDAAAYFSRPGPRLIDGVELLASLTHPQLVR